MSPALPAAAASVRVFLAPTLTERFVLVRQHRPCFLLFIAVAKQPLDVSAPLWVGTGPPLRAGGGGCSGASGEVMLDRELKRGFRLDENQTLNHLNNGSLCKSSFIMGTYV